MQIESSVHRDLLITIRAAAEQLVADLEAAEADVPAPSTASLVARQVELALDRCLQTLGGTGLVGEDNRLPSSELWRIAGSRLECGVLQLRARQKPRGYAGDYQMLQMILDNFRCDHRWGSAFDAYFQTRQAPRAVRNRTNLIANTCRQAIQNSTGSFYIVGIGAGPAAEIDQTLIGLSPSQQNRLQVTLFDLDPEALASVQARLKSRFSLHQLRFVRSNLYRLPRVSRDAVHLRNADFLFCAGFFDYLQDQDAVAMLRLFWNHVSPAGQLIVMNFSPHIDCRGYMEWIGNWYLTYRTQAQMQDLAEQAGIPRTLCRFGAEPTGGDLYLLALRKN